MKKSKPAGKLRSLQIIPLLLFILLLASCTGGKQSFSFIQLSDPQLGMDGYAHDMASYRQAVKQVNELDVDFVVICGDMVHHASDSSFADFLQISAQLEVPYYVVPGNHDVEFVPDDTTLTRYRELFGDDYFTFDHKGTTFLLTNTQLWKSNIGEASDRHDLWFSSALENVKKNRHIVVVGHYPLYIQTPDEEEIYSNLPPDTRARLLQLFENHNVAAYLSGHRHEFIQHNHQGIQLVSVESTSKNFDGRPLGFRRWDVSRDTLVHHFIEIEPAAASIND